LFSSDELHKLIRISKEGDDADQVGASYVFKDVADYECTSRTAKVADVADYGIDLKVDPSEFPPPLPSMSGEIQGETTPLRVTEIRTKVRLQWPDGRISEEWSTSIVPHHRKDE
jgi:hypothetical protein